MPFEWDRGSGLAVSDMPAAAPNAVDERYNFEGHVDFYGYHPTAQGWFFCGWIAHPWPVGSRPQYCTAQFSGGGTGAHELSTFYYRDDVSGRGIGFVFFIRAAAAAPGLLQHLEIASDAAAHRVRPPDGAAPLPERDLADVLHSILAGGEAGSQRRRMFDLLQGGRPAQAVGGFVDFYGYHAVSGGWLLCGWVARGWPEGQPPTHAVLSFEEGDIAGEAVAMLFVRTDLADGAEGAALFVQGSATPLGSLCSVSFEAAGRRVTLYPGPGAPRLREAELVARFRPVLGQAPPGLPRDSVQGLLLRQPYNGEDTLGGLNDAVFFEIDEAIACGSDGLLLLGWCLAKPGALRGIRLRCGGLSTPLDLARCVRIDRPDVLAAFAPQHGFDNAGCGFIAYLPQSVAADARAYIEVETHRREIGFRGVPKPRLDGIAAMRRVLDVLDVRFGDVAPAFDRTIGPAMEAINRSRLAARPAAQMVDYGRVPAEPRFSVIVPLYGRLDYVEYQMALFSAHAPSADVEYIYVLDDPPKRKEAQFLFASVHARFGIPFRALLLDRNVGFAPACNIGLQQARGRHIIYLNSDVFPGTPDWLERLGARLDDDPSLGVVGPVLLFEDGSVQHRGIAFEKLREFGDWYFPLHSDKGLRQPAAEGLRDCLSITGACMAMPRALAQQVGGFDEIYAVGDFEDTDLCLKLRTLGYRCAVDDGVSLYHLERKSQASSAVGWRMNLTLYNAWQHQRRWQDSIAAYAALAA